MVRVQERDSLPAGQCASEGRLGWAHQDLVQGHPARSGDHVGDRVRDVFSGEPLDVAPALLGSRPGGSAQVGMEFGVHRSGFDEADADVPLGQFLAE